MIIFCTLWIRICNLIVLYIHCNYLLPKIKYLKLYESNFLNNSLSLKISIYSFLTHFSSNSRVFVSPKWGCWSKYTIAIFENCTSSKPFSNIICFNNVLAYHSTSKSIFIIICSSDDLIDVIILKDALNRPKNFFFCDYHIIFCIRKYSWLNKIPFCSMPFSTSSQSCSLLYSKLYIS